MPKSYHKQSVFARQINQRQFHLTA